MNLLKALQRETGMAMILITHDIGLVANMADRVLVMYAGQIIESAPSERLFSHPVHPYTQALLSSVPRLDERGKQKLRTIEGNIPDMTNPPDGCAFCDRCPYAMNICAQYMPVMKPAEKHENGGNCKAGEFHEAACWLMDKRAGEKV